MKRLARILVLFAVCGLLLFWFLTRPGSVSQPYLAVMESGDAAKGERIFWAGGCSSCHARKGAKGDDKLMLGGGHALKTPFGTFYSPNISPDEINGIGGWTEQDFANAMIAGVSPDGSHYYPAFPYTSYTRMIPEDLADLWAFMKTLPPVSKTNIAHELPLPFQFRRGLGLWKTLYLSKSSPTENLELSPETEQGRYLVEALGHCGECHTPRNLIGGMAANRWLAGGPSPEGKGKIPNITPHKSGIGSWTENDIVYSLETGLTPEFDSFGGSMVSVQENMAKLAPEDRAAIAAYLKAIPAVQSE